MPPYPNLISDALLITETIELLQSSGGRAPVVKVVDYVMKIRTPEPDLAKMLVSDLVEKDSRLRLNEDFLELIQTDFGQNKLLETDFVVFDLETTGAKTPPCRITEIGAYKIKNGKVVGEFQTLVNPETPIPPFITGLTGISDRMVRNAPRFPMWQKTFSILSANRFWSRTTRISICVFSITKSAECMKITASEIRISARFTCRANFFPIWKITACTRLPNIIRFI